MEFKVGDKLKIIKQDENDGPACKIGIEDYIDDNDYRENGQQTIRLQKGYCVKPQNIIKIGEAMEFKVGDKVKIISGHTCICKDNIGVIEEEWGWGYEKWKVKFTDVYLPFSSNCYWYMYGENEMIKIGEPMLKYDEIKSKIEALDGNSSLKEADDILQEVHNSIDSTKLPYLSIDIPIRDKVNSGEQKIVIRTNFHTTQIEEKFPYKSQCSKLQALKDACMWLLDHCDIKKSIVGEEKKIEIDGKTYKAKILEEL